MTTNTRKKIKYITNPLLFIDPISEITIFNASTGEKYRKVNTIFYDILLFFIDPKDIEDPDVIKKYSSSLLLDLIEKQFLLDVNSEEYHSAHLWEKRNWSRAGYLMFSQLNLAYIEEVSDNRDQNDLITERRNLMSNYGDYSAYPTRHMPTSITDSVDIPIHKPRKIDLDVMKDRSCARHFNDHKVTFESFSKTLSLATNNIREAEQSRNTKDPFFILNSYYSWTIIYVLVQGVEGLQRGVYYYDIENSKLLLCKKGLEDQEISACIQNQNWINGGGFSLLIGSQWERYAWMYRHSRAYMNLLIQLGELSQEFLTVAYNAKLCGWMTPAVTESKANQLCCIDNASRVDILYFMKFGPADKK